jgi:hypothetical protein
MNANQHEYKRGRITSDPPRRDPALRDQALKYPDVYEISEIAPLTHRHVFLEIILKSAVGIVAR